MKKDSALIACNTEVIFINIHIIVEQMWSRDVVGVAEDLALGLMWNKNAVERDKTIVQSNQGKFC